MSRALSRRLQRIKAVRSATTGSAPALLLITGAARRDGDHGGRPWPVDWARTEDRVWAREPGESEAAFRARIRTELAESCSLRTLMVLPDNGR